MVPHPLRRLLAWWIDKVAAWILLGLIVAVTGLDTQDALITSPNKKPEVNLTFGFDTTQFRPMLTLGSKTCGAPTADTRNFLGQAGGGEVTSASLCINRIFGVPIGGRADIRLTKPDGSAEHGQLELRTVSGPLVHADLLVVLTMLAMGWIGLVTTGRTPGKALTGLRVTGRPLARLAREGIRMSPVLVLFLLPLLPLPLDLPIALKLAIGLGLPAGLAIWLWAKPVLRETPYIPWDRWTGCRLTKAGEEPVIENPFQA